LLLDETKLAGNTDAKRGETVINTTFLLAEGTERERMNNQGSARAARFYFLSTSNQPLRELAQNAKLDVDEAMLGRLVDIHCPPGGYGIYDDLHGRKDGAALTDVLKGRCRRYFGTPSREFVRALQANYIKDAAKLKRFLKDRRKRYLKRCEARAKETGYPKLNRALGRYATVYAAGSLAIRYGILAWKRVDLLNAILSCQFDGLQPAIAKPFERADSITGLKDKLITYLSDNHRQFTTLDKAKLNVKTHKFGSVPGYKATYRSEKWLYLTADRLVKLIGVGPNAKQLKNELAKAGILARANQRYVVQRPIFSGQKGNKGYRRVHAFSAAIIDDRKQA